MCGLAFMAAAFFLFFAFYDGLLYLYHSQNVVNVFILFLVCAFLTLLLLIGLNILMYRGKKVLQIISGIFIGLFIPVAFFAAFVTMLAGIVVGPYGCSYTEDIANYGVYDKWISVPNYFPETITDEMTVVDYCYYYKYSDATQYDIYLEVKFDSKEAMERQLEKAKSAANHGCGTAPNPYAPGYTDMFQKYRWREGYEYGGYVRFGGREDYKYVDANYNAVIYNYEELTIIFNATQLGSDIEMDNDPDMGAYTPKFMERFDLQWDPTSNVSPKIISE